MTLAIVQLGHPALRRKARPLSAGEIRSERIQTLIGDMREAMQRAPGVGLAAPQIGESLQLAVVEDTPASMAHLSERERAERERRAVPFQVLINPRLSVIDAAERLFFEGCLSAQGLVGCVARAAAVRVDCLNERAEPLRFDAYGWHARIVQHEIDHLHGRLYLDRAVLETVMSAENLAAYWSAQTPAAVCRQLAAPTAQAPHAQRGSHGPR